MSEKTSSCFVLSAVILKARHTTCQAQGWLVACRGQAFARTPRRQARVGNEPTEARCHRQASFKTAHSGCVPTAHKEQQGHEQIRGLARSRGDGRVHPPEARLTWSASMALREHCPQERDGGDATCKYFKSMQPSRCVHEHSLLISGLFIADVHRCLCT